MEKPHTFKESVYYGLAYGYTIVWMVFVFVVMILETLQYALVINWPFGWYTGFTTVFFIVAFLGWFIVLTMRLHDDFRRMYSIFTGMFLCVTIITWIVFLVDRNHDADAGYTDPVSAGFAFRTYNADIFLLVLITVNALTIGLFFSVLSHLAALVPSF